MEEVITELATKSFSCSSLANFLAWLSSSYRLKEQIIKVDNYYSQLIDELVYFAHCDDQSGKQLAVYRLELTEVGQISDLDQEFIEQHLADEDFSLVAVSQPQTDDWQLLFIDYKAVLPRGYYYSFPQASDYWQQAWQSETKLLSWSELETVFNGRQLHKEFIADFKELISGLDSELDKELVWKLILQLTLLSFLEEQGWLGVKKEADWGTGNQDFLVSLIEQTDSLSATVAKLVTKVSVSDRRKTTYSVFKLPALGADWELVADLKEFSEQLLAKIIEVLDGYYLSWQEGNYRQQEVALTPRILSDLAFCRLEAQEGSQQGVVYTPPVIVSYLVQSGLVNYLRTKLEIDQEAISQFVYYRRLSPEIKEQAEAIDAQLEQLKICDPAAGTGALTRGALEEIGQLRRKLALLSNSEPASYQFKLASLKRSISGVEINSFATQIMRLRLWLNLVASREDYNQLAHPSLLAYRFLSGNSLLMANTSQSEVERLADLHSKYLNSSDLARRAEIKEELDSLTATSSPAFSFADSFPASFSGRSGFDLVVTNPPYVGEKGNKELFRELKDHRLGEYYTGKMDLFYFFFHLGLELVEDKGHLVLITTNYFLRATNAHKLRLDIKERGTIKKLIDFNELRLFRSAIGQHNLISIIQRGQTEKTAKTVVSRRQGTAEEEELLQLLYGQDSRSDYYSLAQSQIFEGQNNYLCLERDQATGLLAKLSAQGRRLDSFCQINQGLVSGCDRVAPRHLKQYDLEVEVGAGVFVVAQERAAQFGLSTPRRWLKPWFKSSQLSSWAPQQSTSKQRILYLDGSCEQLPAELEKHLESFRPILSARREVEKGRIDWWQLQWPRQKELFSGPKLLVPQRHRENIVAYTEEPWYASADLYYIKEQSGELDLKYLAALLNSKLYYLWFYKKGKTKGDLLELYQRPLAEVPIKAVGPRRQQKFISRVDKLIALKKELFSLEAVSWPEILPDSIAQSLTLAETLADYQILYSGQAQNLREIRVELESSQLIIYSAHNKEGWYRLLSAPVLESSRQLYLRYYLENLSSSQRQEANDYGGGLIKRLLNLKLPLYNQAREQEVVSRWQSIQSKKNSLKAKLARLEAELDQLVYRLYGFSPQEQTLLSEAVDN